MGAICDASRGFGLSSMLSGNFQTVDAKTVWDVLVVAHEIGHNFGSLHTHDGYNPKVDECGVEDSNGKKTCPAELPLEHSSTIMSYCHNCIGGVSYSSVFCSSYRL